MGLTPFTDDDLARLKEYTAKAKWVSFTHDDVRNLLHRLECAEKYISCLASHCECENTWEAWRNAKGELSDSETSKGEQV